MRTARALSPALLAVFILACLPSNGLAASQVRVYPIAGTHTANPGTQISFRDVTPSALGTIQVTGSKSGVHSGRVAPHSDGDGASFILGKGFASGEVVTVRTSLNVLGGKSGQFQFTTALLAGSIPSVPRPAVPPGGHGYERFHTRRDIKPAAIRIRVNRPGTAPGNIFVASQFGPAQSGPAMYSPRGSLLYYTPVPQRDWTTDFRTQQLGGKPVLTWWQGYVNRGTGVGAGIILDSSYRRVAVIRGANGMAADLHEFQLTRRGTALVTSYFPTLRDTSSVRGARRTAVLDGVVQEIDVKTGLVLFEWHSLDHVGFSDSHIAAPRVNGHLYDYFHINSVKETPDGSLLISSRNTWAGYKVNYASGAVQWRLGGRRSSFRMGVGTFFAWQHDLEVRRDGAITVFDNEAGPPVGTQSRLTAIRVDLARHTASRVGRLVHTPPLLAAYEGNQQTLPNGNVFTGWGQQPIFSEFDSRGRLLFDARFNAPTPTYRAYRLPWKGQPLTRPAIAPVATSPRTVTVFTSWNGATEVASWRVLAGPAPDRLTSRVRTVRRLQFETPIHATTREPYVAVQALDGGGRVLATSSARHR